MACIKPTPKKTTKVLLLVGMAHLVGALELGAETVQTPVSTWDDIAFGVAIHSDGKIVLGGYGGNPAGLILARYNTDLSLDSTFDGDGILAPPGVMSQCRGIGIRALDDTIVAFGHTSSATNKDWVLARFLPDGSADTSFGGTGVVVTQVQSPDRDDTSSAVVVLADGRIVAAGASARNANNQDFAVARYNADGTLDTTFNGTGTATTGIQSPDKDDFGTAVAVQADGKIVVAGYTEAATRDVAVVRYNTNGTLDTTFNGTGIATTDTGFSDHPWGVAIQTDGKIVVAGYTSAATTDFLLIRYSANGTLDTTGFGTGGIVITDATGSADRIEDVTLQPDGKILVAGEAWPGDADFVLARYNPDGTLDTTCNGTGIAITDVGGWEDGAYALAMQSASQIVLGGYSQSGTGWDYGLVRYTSSCLTTSVTLSSFEAEGASGEVRLSWETASELNNLGFHIHRATSAEGPYERITSRPIPGLGSSPVGARYSYRDDGVVGGVTYFYELEDIETTGRTELHGPVWATPSERLASEEGSRPVPPDAGGPSTTDSSVARITYGEPEAVSLRVVERTEQAVELELVTGGFFATPQPDGSVRLEIPGFEVAGAPGTPAVPVRRRFLEAVAGRRVRIAGIVPADVVGFSSLRPSPAEAAEMVVGHDGTVRAGRRKVRAAWRSSEIYPSQAARVVGTAFQGDVKKALVELAPLRWDPASGQLLLARRLRVRVLFSRREAGETALGGSRGRAPRGGSRLHGSSEDGSILVRLVTREAGLYSVGFEQMLPGKRRPLPASRMRLARLGEDVAFHLEPSSPRFGPRSTLYFLSAGASLGEHANEAVYELSLDTTQARMEVASVPPRGPELHHAFGQREWETDRYYVPGLLDAADIWIWESLVSGRRASFPFSLSGLATGVAEPATLQVWLEGGSDFVTSPDHHVRAFASGWLVGEASWDGKRPQAVQASIPAGLLREGENLLELENVADTSAAYSFVSLDRFALHYPQVLASVAGRFEGRFDSSGTATLAGLGAGSVALDTTEAGTPRWLTGTLVGPGGLSLRVEAGHRYLVVSPAALLSPGLRWPSSSDLRSTANQADYLLLAPRELLPAAQPLLRQRESEDLTVRGVALEEVFDLFGHGERSPQAIQDFLGYAYHYWSAPSPRYVLLLGDATHDPKDHAGTGVVDQLPAWVFRSSYLWTASDPRYAAVNGDDWLPDLAIGRLPAASLEQARILIEKTLAFESNGFDLSGPAVLVADNSDGAGDFEGDIDEIASGLLSAHPTEKIFLGRLGKAASRTAILDAFDRGASLMSYVGHGGPAVWASENILNSWDVSRLSAQAQQPLLFTMTCLNGYFLPPSFDALSEALVKASDKGAIAAFSPSGPSLNDAAHRYHEALLRHVLSGRHARLGDAILAAQGDYATTGACPELLSIYHLFGDPALRIR